MIEPDRIVELEARNGALRTIVDRYLLRADPMTIQALDQIASELEFSGDAAEDLERTYVNLRRRAALLVENKVAESGSFDETFD